MSLIEITESTHNIVLDLRYATPNNFTGEVIYPHARCFLHLDALKPLEALLLWLGSKTCGLKILDAYRPQSAQEKFWSICPNPNYIMPPEKGSHHTRGIAMDLTPLMQQGRIRHGIPF